MTRSTLAALRFYNRMVRQVIQRQIESIEYKEKSFFWSIFIVFVFLVLSYGLLLNSIMIKAVSKQNMEKGLASLGSEVNTLEFNYLSVKNSITMDFAKSKGFISLSSDKFAVIDSPQKNISLSINEN